MTPGSSTTTCTGDGYSRGNGSAFDNTDTFYAGDNGAGVYDYEAFLLFPDIGIPQGATITSAYVDLYIASLPVTQSNLDMIIDAEDADDPAVPTSYSDATGRTHTTANASWQPTGLSTGTTVSTPSIVSVIQELVDRAGWTTSSNALIFIGDVTAGDSGVERRIGWDGIEHADSGRHAVLYVEYTS